ncbi:MAG: hypothetical protein J6X52_00265 [Clostridia bacterium]|nr:hypothetical protein [Clostridia bacterium]
MINKGLLLIISGPAGVGKGTIVNYLVEGESNYFKSVSATSRKPRYMEREGEDYYFVTRAEFMRRVKRGEMLEYTEYNGNYYGTPLPPMKAHFEAGENVVLEIETDGAFQVKSVKADHVKKITEIETDADLDLDKVKEVITAAGYTVNGFTTEA